MIDMGKVIATSDFESKNLITGERDNRTFSKADMIAFGKFILTSGFVPKSEMDNNPKDTKQIFDSYYNNFIKQKEHRKFK